MTVTDLKALWVVTPIDNKSVAINGYKGNNCEIRIPSTIGTKTVTRIGERAFRPESHRVQKNVYRALESIMLPDTIEYIGAEAFANCKSLKEIKLPSSLLSIGHSAFENCESLKEIILPSNLRSVSPHLFAKCSNLEKCVFLSQTTHLSQGAFYDCKKLSQLVVKTSSSEKEYIVEPEWYSFCGCESLNSITLKDGIDIIPDGAFYNCSSLKNIHIPDSVHTICTNAFRNCIEISQITIPASVKLIKYWAFLGMKNLRIVEYHSDDVIIESDAFKDCPKLK